MILCILINSKPDSQLLKLGMRSCAIILLGFCLIGADAFECKASTCRNGGTCHEDKEKKVLPTCK